MVAPELFIAGEHSIQMHVCDIEVMIAAAEFLQRYQPELLARLAKNSSNEPDDRASIITKHAIRTASERTEEERLVAVALQVRAPRSITVPTITTEHWAYKAHYDPGHGVSALASEAHSNGYSRYEAETDTGAALDYIRAYAELAQNYTGPNLHDAVLCAAFRDPYYTCMEICLLELKLPSHFIALIHYGIGIYKLTGSRISSPRDKASDGELETSNIDTREHQLHADIQNAFECLTQMYLEDFA
jgi:hypothetical protein